MDLAEKLALGWMRRKVQAPSGGMLVFVGWPFRPFVERCQGENVAACDRLS